MRDESAHADRDARADFDQLRAQRRHLASREFTAFAADAPHIIHQHIGRRSESHAHLIREKERAACAIGEELALQFLGTILHLAARGSMISSCDSEIRRSRDPCAHHQRTAPSPRTSGFYRLLRDPLVAREIDDDFVRRIIARNTGRTRVFVLDRIEEVLDEDALHFDQRATLCTCIETKERRAGGLSFRGFGGGELKDRIIPQRIIRASAALTARFFGAA